ncbi:MAG: hypothetical protein OEW12_00180 [Deltaproteobacteria bacterium]|nr:hypothetical protein [Deltaproteobacteria bacterium]
MNRTGKIIIGVLCVWPLFYAGLLLLWVTREVLGVYFNSGHYPFVDPPASFLLMMGFHLFTMLVLMALVPFCIWHLVKNPRLVQDRKWMWGGGLLFVSVFALPAYWFYFIWPDADPVSDGFSEAPSVDQPPPNKKRSKSRKAQG